MHLILSGFVAGVILLQCSPILFPTTTVMAVVSGISLLVYGVWRYGGMARPLRLGSWFALAVIWGFAYAHVRAEWRLEDHLSPTLEGQEVVLTGIVDGLPESVSNGQRFLFRLQGAEPGIPRMLSLAWFSEGTDTPLPALQPGQMWQLHCRLKYPHGLVNPGGFDMEAWALAQGIRATGTVLRQGSHRLLPSEIAGEHIGPGIILERLRDRIRQRILLQLKDRHWAGVLVALVVGDQSLIRQEDWRMFWNTGVGHLISISGLHITLLSGLVARLAGWCWPSLRIRWLAGMAGAALYALLAGFSVPTQRTLYMIGVVTFTRLAQIPAPGTMVLLVALTVVVLADPWAPLSSGFWLSFGAVGALMYADAYTVGHRSFLQSAFHTQWSATWAMVPLLIYLFGQVSLISPLANAFAIPIVSLGVVPLALLGAIPGMDPSLQAAHDLFAAVAWGLAQLDRWPVAVWSVPMPSPIALAAGLLGLAFLLAPAGLPGRWAGTCALWVMLLMPAPRPEPGGVWMDVLDVGQGLAVVIRTRDHALIYDTGPRYGPENDGGSRVVLPALRALGIRRLDGLIISHSDSDHSGGAATLLKNMSSGWLLSSLEPTHALTKLVPHALPCYAGQYWEWDGVRFDILHPLESQVWDAHRKSNDRGCVLRVTAQEKHVLLPADVEALSEMEMLERDKEALAADVLVAPHHGSRTSSTERFLDAVAPRWALFTVGYRNHFGHPKPDVVARYDARHIRWLRTDQTGAVTVKIENHRIGVSTAREQFPHYWAAEIFSGN